MNLTTCEGGVKFPYRGVCPECKASPGDRCPKAVLREQQELCDLRDFVGWVESWVSNPVGAYSVSALDGLFGMTRDKIAALHSSMPLPSDERS